MLVKYNTKALKILNLNGFVLVRKLFTNYLYQELNWQISCTDL